MYSSAAHFKIYIIFPVSEMEFSFCEPCNDTAFIKIHYAVRTAKKKLLDTFVNQLHKSFFWLFCKYLDTNPNQKTKGDKNWDNWKESINYCMWHEKGGKFAAQKWLHFISRQEKCDQNGSFSWKKSYWIDKDMPEISLNSTDVKSKLILRI